MPNSENSDQNPGEAASTGSRISSSAHFVAVACGAGDSLLLRLGNRWIAVDCHLPAGGRRSVWDRYAGCVSRLGINRLDAFVITHFDIDHIRGAARLVEWFIGERDGVGGIYVTGSYALKAAVESKKRTIKVKAVRSEFDRLLSLIERFCPPNDTKTRIQPRTADDPPLEILSSEEEGWAIVSVYPFRIREPDAIQDAATADSLYKLNRVDQNDLSAALMVCSKDIDFPLLLLGGDVPGDPAWGEAIEFWQEKITDFHGSKWDWLPTDMGPVWIKVPHHGSWIQGHSPAIFRGHKPPVSRHAVVSSGNNHRQALPDKRTLRAYLDEGFSVWNTGLLPTSVDADAQRPWSLEMLSKAAHRESHADIDCIEIHWPENSPTPIASKIDARDLGDYSEASGS